MRTPSREDQLEPGHETDAEQQADCGGVAEHGEPPGDEPESSRERGRRDGEHGRHPQAVDGGQRRRAATTERPHAPRRPAGRASAAVLISPAATAPDTKNMPTKSRPLPRKTVAKNRSSPGPMRSRSTPMNHRKAIPANGSSWRLSDTALRRASSSTQVPASNEPGGSAHSGGRPRRRTGPRRRCRRPRRPEASGSPGRRRHGGRWVHASLRRDPRRRGSASVPAPWFVPACRAHHPRRGDLADHPGRGDDSSARSAHHRGVRRAVAIPIRKVEPSTDG